MSHKGQWREQRGSPRVGKDRGRVLSDKGVWMKSPRDWGVPGKGGEGGFLPLGAAPAFTVGEDRAAGGSAFLDAGVHV